MREAGLTLVGAHVREPLGAVGAASTPARERRGDSVADGPAAYVGADRHDLAGELVTGHVRQLHRIVSEPRVPVRPAHATRPDPEHDAVIRAGGLGYVGDDRQLAALVVDDRTHRRLRWYGLQAAGDRAHANPDLELGRREDPRARRHSAAPT